MKHRRAIWVTACLATITLVAHLLVVMALTHKSFSDIFGHALHLAQLAEYGESFTPVTTIFAVAAAVFAALAFQTQRQTYQLGKV